MGLQEELALAMCDHPNINKLICSFYSATEHVMVSMSEL